MANRRLKVFLLGGDREGWALDTELRLARQALSSSERILLVDRPESADVLHTVWPEQLLERPSLRKIWENRIVVASFSNDPLALFERVPGLYDAAQKWICVAQSALAFRQLRGTGISRVEQVPYRVDDGAFAPIGASDPRVLEAKRALRVPPEAYVIGFFQRDSLGSDLSRMKVQKAPDFFSAIVQQVHSEMSRVHVLLAGPRRHWIRERLARSGVPFSFFGEVTSRDDYPAGVISRAEMNLLINCCDLNMVTSRWEGAPRAIMECVAAEKKVISTPVGIAEDLLEGKCIFRNLPEAVRLIKSDMETGGLAPSVAPQKARLESVHGLKNVARCWLEVYDRIEPRHPKVDSPIQAYVRPVAAQWSELRARVSSLVSSRKKNLAWISSSPNLRRHPLAESLETAMREKLLSMGCLKESIEDVDFLLVEGVPSGAVSRNCKQTILHRIRSEDIENPAVFHWNRSFADLTLFSTAYDWLQVIRSGQRITRPRIVREGGITLDRVPGPGDIQNLVAIGRVDGLTGVKLKPASSIGDLSEAQGLLLTEDSTPARAAAVLAGYLGLPLICPRGTGVSEIAGFSALCFSDAGELPLVLEGFYRQYRSLRELCVPAEEAETLLGIVAGGRLST